MKLKRMSKNLDRNLYPYISQANDGPPKKREPLIKKVLCLNLGIYNSDIQLQVGKLLGKMARLGRPELVSRTASFDANPPPLG